MATRFPKSNYKTPDQCHRSRTVAGGVLDFPTRTHAQEIVAPTVNNTNANSKAILFDIAGVNHIMPQALRDVLATDPATGQYELTSPTYRYFYSHAPLYQDEGKALEVANEFYRIYGISIHTWMEPVRAIHRDLCQQRGWGMNGAFPVDPHVPVPPGGMNPVNLLQLLNAAGPGGLAPPASRSCASGPAPHGPAPLGPAPHGPAPHGPAPHGPAPPAPHGPAPPAPHGPAPPAPGPAPPAPHGPAPPAPLPGFGFPPPVPPVLADGNPVPADRSHQQRTRRGRYLAYRDVDGRTLYAQIQQKAKPLFRLDCR